MSRVNKNLKLIGIKLHDYLDRFPRAPFCNMIERFEVEIKKKIKDEWEEHKRQAGL